MNVKKLLWPTDFSNNAAHALPYVTSLMEKYDTEVHVIYVMQEIAEHGPWYGEFNRKHLEEVKEWEHKKAEEHLEKICKNHLEGCPLYIKHISSGDPAEEILKVAHKEKVDMIVMATRGQRGRFGFGSVADRVVKNTDIPVVTIPVPVEEEEETA